MSTGRFPLGWIWSDVPRQTDRSACLQNKGDKKVSVLQLLPETGGPGQNSFKVWFQKTSGGGGHDARQLLLGGEAKFPKSFNPFTFDNAKSKIDQLSKIRN